MPGLSAHRGGGRRAGDPFDMTRKGREQSRGPLVPFRHAKPEPYVRKSPLGAPTYTYEPLSRSP
eukprot:4652308-Prymnesium_polylepis.1